MQHEKYARGISCEFCFDQQTPEQRERFSQREKQMQLAESRGDVHLGGDAIDTINKRRQQKRELRDAQRK
ncbi:MAG: rhodanese domain-containing protein [Osedax symbiont Rs1]|nr:MAG: rhodanese domain-containing protein [Osedax symbiont Rs1]